MIQISDNFLPREVFENLQEYCYGNDFKIVEIGEKKFSVLQTPDELLQYLQVDGHQLILTFIRNAYESFDTDLRIHADNIINGHKTSIASVLYLNRPEEVSSNGTAFWNHINYGLTLPDNTSEEEFNRLITEDSNDISKWCKAGLIYSVPNRMVVYQSNYFHSKWPKVIEKGTRIVLVCFYKKNE